MSQSIRSHLTKKLQKESSHQFKSNGPVLLFKTVFGTESVPCRLLLRVVKMKFEKQEHYLYIWATALSVKTSAKN